MEEQARVGSEFRRNDLSEIRVSTPLLAISFGFVALVSLLALRLARSAWRWRRLPDALMALFFLGGGTFGYGLLLCRVWLGEASPGLLHALQRGAETALQIPVVCIALFTWLVFRREQPWACYLALGLAGASLGGYALILAGPGLGDTAAALAAPGGLVFWTATATRACCFAWAGLEAGRYYGFARRRVALGLADPLVTNRFLLWTIWSGAAAAMLVARVASPFLYDAHDPLAEVPRLLVVWQLVAGAVCGGAVWLTFSPPASYRRLVQRSASAV